MNTVSKALLIGAAFAILVALYIEQNEIDKEPEIRRELERRGLPSPAFADTEKLKNILILG